jgi:uncharacterized Zn finger protein (UPF0148 family)
MLRHKNLSLLSKTVAARLNRELHIGVTTCDACGKIILIGYRRNGKTQCPNCSERHE